MPYLPVSSNGTRSIPRKPLRAAPFLSYFSFAFIESPVLIFSMRAGVPALRESKGLASLKIVRAAAGA
jgi:hypothetical protein